MSNLSLERLKFDPASASEGPLVGSYLVAADGTVLSDSGTSGALNVHVVNSVTVTASDLDIRNLDYSQDNVQIKSASGVALAIDASGYLTANINGTVTVSATNLDIRDLTHASDSVKIGDGSEFLAVNADGSINVNLTDDSVADGATDTGNPLKIGAHAYDQASALAAVDADDRVNLATDLYRRVLVSDAPNVSAACAAVAVDDTVGGVLLGTALAGRTRILIQNRGALSIFVGPSGVTISSGIEISKGSTMTLELGESVDLYGISSSATASDVRVMQLA